MAAESLSMARLAVGDGSVIDEAEFGIQMHETIIKKNLGMRRYVLSGRHVERRGHD